MACTTYAYKYDKHTLLVVSPKVSQMLFPPPPPSNFSTSGSARPPSPFLKKDGVQERFEPTPRFPISSLPMLYRCAIAQNKRERQRDNFCSKFCKSIIVLYAAQIPPSPAYAPLAIYPHFSPPLLPPPPPQPHRAFFVPRRRNIISKLLSSKVFFWEKIVLCKLK